MGLHITNFSHASTVVMALVVVITYSLNIGALSEADILVNPDPAVTAELVMSSFLLLLAAIAIASVFIHIGMVEWWVEQRHLLMTIILSFVVLSTYALNLSLLNLDTKAKKNTGLSHTESVFSGVLVGVASLLILIAILRFFFGRRKSVGASFASSNNKLIKQMLGSGSGKKAAQAVDPLTALSQAINAENATK